MQLTKRCRAAVTRLAKTKRAEGVPDAEIKTACEWYLRARGFLFTVAKREAAAIVDGLKEDGDGSDA